MAIIQCRECGSQVSDSAPSCPQCGAGAPGGACSLVFTRPSMMGATTGVEVFVDGQPYGKLRARGRVVATVAAGSHHVELQSSHGKSTSSTVDARGSEVSLVVKIGLTGSPKLG